MKLNLSSTPELVMLNDTLPARIWEGTTASGIKVQAYITIIQVDPADQAAFERDCGGPLFGAHTVETRFEDAIDPRRN
jgi:hypothetical protein